MNKRIKQCYERNNGSKRSERTKREQGGIFITHQEKINIVLDARPRLVHIIKCATDVQLDLLVEEKELERELDETAFVLFFKLIV